ncbi:MAG: Rrf2 family transcriptional regulator [Nitrospinae bacterium]|nr:Rrf2 family transcriptional regulator [Nitrospinota bacterium]
MQLTRYTDYSLRVLVYLGVFPGRLVTIHEIAESYAISGNHLMKIVNKLGIWGYVHTVRGKKGGIRLARDPKEINIGDVIRHTEERFDLAECFLTESNQCPLFPSCAMENILKDGVKSFLAVLDKYTLGDVLGDRPEEMAKLFNKKTSAAKT